MLTYPKPSTFLHEIVRIISIIVLVGFHVSCLQKTIVAPKTQISNYENKIEKRKKRDKKELYLSSASSCFLFSSSRSFSFCSLCCFFFTSLSSRSLCSLSNLRSGFFSTFVLFKRLTISLIRFSTLIFLTCKFTSHTWVTWSLFEKKVNRKQCNLFFPMESYLTNFHSRCFFQIGPHGINNINIVHLVSLDTICFHQLSSIF